MDNTDSVEHIFLTLDGKHFHEIFISTTSSALELVQVIGLQNLGMKVRALRAIPLDLANANNRHLSPKRGPAHRADNADCSHNKP